MSQSSHQTHVYAWRQREANAIRKAEEEEHRKKTARTETNFPILSTATPIPIVTGNRYMELAQNWATKEADTKKSHVSTDRLSAYVFTERRRHLQSMDDDEEEEYEEDIGSSRAADSRVEQDDESGWTEVKRKAYKAPRERTFEEMDRMEKEIQEQESTSEFNAHLLESNRHDHHRV